MELHQNCKQAEWLLGTWKGKGKCTYPTIKSVDYEETTTFTHFGKPFFLFSQKTCNAETKAPLHQEYGYFRFPKDGVVEFVNAQPTGITEILEGTIKVKTIILESTHIDRTSSAKSPHVLKSQRVFTLNGGVLSCTMDMETENTKMEGHLVCSLKKVE